MSEYDETPSGPLDATFESALEGITDETTLDTPRLTAALLEACGARPKEISKRLGMSEQWVYQMRYKDVEYSRVVRLFHNLVARKTVAQASDIDSLFNQQILPSAATLIDIRDNPWSKDADRIKSALAFLDRAPKAPKTQHVQESTHFTINFPIEMMREAKKALIAEGSEESLKVLEMQRKLEEGSGGEQVGGKEEFEVRRFEE